jgi:hypothetical protein
VHIIRTHPQTAGVFFSSVPTVHLCDGNGSNPFRKTSFEKASKLSSRYPQASTCPLDHLTDPHLWSLASRVSSFQRAVFSGRGSADHARRSRAYFLRARRWQHSCRAISRRSANVAPFRPGNLLVCTGYEIPSTSRRNCTNGLSCRFFDCHARYTFNLYTSNLSAS